MLIKSKKILFLSLLLTLILFLNFYVYQLKVAIPRNIDRSDSATSRLDTWTQGFELFLKHPVLGIGFNSYKYALEKYHLADNTQIAQKGSASNDASLLFILSTTGFLGFSSFLLFLGSSLYFSFLMRKTTTGKLVFSGISGLLVNSIFINSLFYPAVFIWLILYLGSLKFSNSSG